MINMMKADVYRLFRSKMAYIAVGIFLLLGALSIWQQTPGASIFSASVDTQVETVDSSQANPDDNTINAINTNLDNTKNASASRPIDRRMLENGINLYYVFIFLVGVIVVQDFSFKAVKNSLTSAINRKTYFLSKLLTSLIVCLALTYGYTLFVYVLNVLFNGVDSSTSLVELLKITILQTPYYIGLVGLLVGIIFVGQKAASYYGFSIAILICVSIILLTLQLTGLVNLISILPFEPQTALDIVAGNPDSTYLWKFTAIGFVAFILFSSLGYLRFNRTEIK